MEFNFITPINFKIPSANEHIGDPFEKTERFISTLMVIFRDFNEHYLRYLFDMFNEDVDLTLETLLKEREQKKEIERQLKLQKTLENIKQHAEYQKVNYKQQYENFQKTREKQSESKESLNSILEHILNHAEHQRLKTEK